jgi:hypothetical protein
MGNFKTARYNFEKKVMDLMHDLDPSGYNENMYQDYFKTLTDEQFKTFVYNLYMKEDFNLFFEMGLLDRKNNLTLKKIKNIAAKRNVDLMEYVEFPYKRPDHPEDPPISNTKIPVIYTVVRPLQQLLEKKNNMSSNTATINSLTGQVTGSSKASTVSNMQTISLITSNQLKTIKEMHGPRSDDLVAKLKMIEKIESDGDYDIDDITIHPGDKQALETMRVMLVGSGFRVSYGKREKLSYILPL